MICLWLVLSLAGSGVVGFTPLPPAPSQTRFVQLFLLCTRVTLAIFLWSVAICLVTCSPSFSFIPLSMKNKTAVVLATVKDIESRRATGQREETERDIVEEELMARILSTALETKGGGSPKNESSLQGRADSPDLEWVCDGEECVLKPKSADHSAAEVALSTTGGFVSPGLAPNAPGSRSRVPMFGFGDFLKARSGQFVRMGGPKDAGAFGPPVVILAGFPHSMDTKEVRMARCPNRTQILFICLWC